VKHKKQSFEHFYLTKVALGDCCGCAERVIDWRDIDLAAQEKFKTARPQKTGFRARFKSLWKATTRLNT